MDFLFLFIFALVPLVVLFVIWFCIRKYRSIKSRLPFEIADYARVPGFSLAQLLKDKTVDQLLYGLMASIYFQMIFSLPQIASFFSIEYTDKEWVIFKTFFGLSVLYLLWRSFSAFHQSQNIRLGLESEWAVADSLAQISDKRVRVFHDVQGPNFNIDHVLTYHGGILAIETKGRRKPNQKDNKETHILNVRGDKLVFPHYTDTSTVEQAKRQAKWLSCELASSTGINTPVNPVVVIPGWYVETKEKPVIPVINNKMLPKYYCKISSTSSFDEAMLSRINHQLAILSKRGSDEF